MAANICVLFTANDAYMRDFGLIVPSDCVASNTEDENRRALRQMADILKADVSRSAEVSFPSNPRRHGRSRPTAPSTEFAPTE